MVSWSNQATLKFVNHCHLTRCAKNIGKTCTKSAHVSIETAFLNLGGGLRAQNFWERGVPKINFVESHLILHHMTTKSKSLPDAKRQMADEDIFCESRLLKLNVTK